MSSRRGGPGSTPSRWLGIDVARSLAVGGMTTSHLGTLPTPWNQVVDGPPSALFAVLAGVSLGLIGDVPARAGGRTATRSTVGLVARGVILIALHHLITPFSGLIVVVLQALGLGYVLLAVAPRLPTRALLGMISVTAACSAAVNVAHGPRPTTGDVLTGAYPVFAWLTYMLAGLVVARALLRATTRTRLMVAGAAGVVAAAGFSSREPIDPFGLYPLGSRVPRWVLLAADPTGHSGGLIDLMTGIGTAVGVIAVCLVVTDRHRVVRTASFPLQAMGSMTLTIYVAHVLTAERLGTYVLRTQGPGQNDAVVWTLTASLLLASLWRLHAARGPLETVNRHLVEAASRALVPAPENGADAGAER